MSKRNLLTLVPVIAFTVLLLAGLVVSVLSLRAVPEQDWEKLADIKKILSGESSKHLTDLLNQNFLLGSTFNHIQRGINWNLTGDLGPDVRAGCADWMFLTDELTVYPGRKVSAELRAEIVAKLSDVLRSQGIRMIVAVIPDKTRIEHRQLCGLHRPAQFQQRISDWRLGLGQQGAEVLDLTSALAASPADAYYHTDTHWNEAGASAAAFSLAASLAGLNLAAAPDPAAVQLNERRVARDGDLVHLAGLDGLPGFLRPGIEMASVTDVAPVAVVSDDLFGDAGLPSIALIGTSYSRNSNFVPFFEHYLDQPVANLARDGGDFSRSAIAYFSGASFRDSPPRVVVWEIPERMIEKPVTQAEREWLEKLTRGTP